MSTKVNYQEYLASREWAQKKKAVQKRSGGVCERCHRNPHQQTHHLTYERVGDELLEDLLGVCAGCHEFLSAESNADPANPPKNPAHETPPASDHEIVQAFTEKADKLGVIPADVDEFNKLIQPVIASAHPATALKLAHLKVEANKRFLQRRGNH